jgi:hypothetical protein
MENSKKRKCSSCRWFEPYDGVYIRGKCHQKEIGIENAKILFICKDHELNQRE